MFKKILFVTVLAVTGFFLIRNSAPVSPPSSPAGIPSTATVIIDTGQSPPATFSAQLSASETALSLLQKVTASADIPLGTQQFDFGTLVYSIYDSANSSQAAWIYFINGQSANVGADSYRVLPDDRIEWRYIAPL